MDITEVPPRPSTLTPGTGAAPPSGPGGHCGRGPDDTSPEVADLWRGVGLVTQGALPTMGLAAGLRPAADVDALVSVVAAAEYELARRMHTAAASGALPLAGDGAMVMARFWSAGWSRRLARTGAFAEQHPAIAAPWAAGVITSEHVDALARRADSLRAEEMSALIEQLAGRWGRHTPETLARFVQRVIRTLHPPADPEPDEAAAHAARGLSFALHGDTVLLAGSLPRLEGEALISAVDAFAERMRSQADHVPVGARRADALVALVNAAATGGGLPTRGGLPVSLTVTVDRSRSGDALWSTSRGHPLTAAEQRFTACSASITPVALQSQPPGEHDPQRHEVPSPERSEHNLGERIAGLAVILMDERTPLAAGRTQRSATAAQRRALAARDRGCIIPGCGIPAEACQTHHLTEWSAGGSTDLHNLVLLCWAHHRQVDLRMWTIVPTDPLRPGTEPERGSSTATAWPANNGAPWTVRVAQRAEWRT